MEIIDIVYNLAVEMPTAPVKVQKTTADVHKMFNPDSTNTNKTKIIMRGAVKIAAAELNKPEINDCYALYYELQKQEHANSARSAKKILDLIQ